MTNSIVRKIYLFNRSVSSWKLAAGAALVLAVFLTGCAAHRDYVEERHFTEAPETPPFLNPSFMAILSNTPAFGAQCKLERPAVSGSGAKKPLEGALLHRGNQVLFATAMKDKRKQGKNMTYIWNISENSGNALNDALTGFAPILGTQGTSPVARVQKGTSEVAAEKIDGHLCRRDELLITNGDGTESRFLVFSASDLNGVPLRIQCEGGGPQYTLDLSDVQLQEPGADLFELPADFTRYASVKAMFEELFRRESFGRPRERQDLPKDDDDFQGQRTGPFRGSGTGAY